jgi:hypothetical protein
LVDETKRAAVDVVTARDADQLELSWPALVSYAVIDAVKNGEARIAKNEDLLDLQQKADTERAETARVGKQIGAGPTSPGTTSLVEGAGLARLLALAIERGAVKQEEDGTSLTLGSTPYALGVFALGVPDTADNYARYGYLSRLAVSGNFEVDDNDGGGTQNVDFDQMSQVMAKLRLGWGSWDRSPRSPAFQELWEKTVKPAHQARIEKLTETLAQAINGNAALTALSNQVEKQVKTAIASDLPAAGASETEKREAAEKIASKILAALWKDIFLRVRDEGVSLTSSARERLELLEGELDTANIAASAASAELLKAIDELNRKPESALTYILNRVDAGSDFSTVKLIGQKGFGPLDIALNGEISFLHNPDPSQNQNTLRDYGASVSLTRVVDDVLLGAIRNNGLEKITLSLAGGVDYLEEVDDVIGTAQLRTALPIWGGVNLPIALTYSSRSEESEDEEFRINIGGGLDVDKMMALWRLASNAFPH